MSYWIYGLLFVITLFTAIKTPRKRKSSVIYIIPLILTWVLINSNTSGDNQQYMTTYLYFRSNEFDELLWGQLVQLGRLANLDFWTFKKVITATSLVILYFGLKDRAYNFNYFLFLYIISFLFMDSQVLRNFVAMCIFIFATRYLENLLYKGNLLKYLLLIAVCTLLHVSFIVYAIFALMAVKNRKWVRRIAVSFVVLCFVVFMFGNRLPLINIVANNAAIGDRSIFLTTKTRLGAVPVFVLYLYMLIIMNYCKKTVGYKLEERGMRLFNMIQTINVLIATILPLCLFSLHFYRLIKNVAILNYACLGNCYMKYRTIGTKVTVFLMSLFLAIGWLIFECFIYANFRDIVMPVFI